MVDLNTVCCLCGDIGFPEKLFRCARCISRFQHTYCSNYYEEGSPEGAGFCDWCRSETRPTSSTWKAQVAAAGHHLMNKSQPRKVDRRGAASSGLAPSAGNNPKLADHDRDAGGGEGGRKQQRQQCGPPEDRAAGPGGRGKSGSGAAEASARPAGRCRYKLLKDVLR